MGGRGLGLPPFSAALGCPLPMPPAPAAFSPPLLLSPHVSHLQMAVPRSSSPSDSCRLGSLGRRIVLRGARGRRKLARLRVAKRPPRRRGLGTPHLQRERPGRAGASSRSPSLDKAQLSLAGRLSSEAGRTERSKRMRLYSRKGNYKKVHVHGSHPHDRQRPMEGPNNS